MLRGIGLVGVCLLAAVSIAAAQEGRADVAVSGMAVFTKDSSGNGIDQAVTNSGGILGSFRYQFRGHSGVELNYGYTRNSQIYTNGSAFTFQEQQANVHELTAAYVYQFNHRKKLSPFLLGGGVSEGEPTGVVEPRVDLVRRTDYGRCAEYRRASRRTYDGPSGMSAERGRSGMGLR